MPLNQETGAEPPRHQHTPRWKPAYARADAECARELSVFTDPTIATCETAASLVEALHILAELSTEPRVIDDEAAAALARVRVLYQRLRAGLSDPAVRSNVAGLVCATGYSFAGVIGTSVCAVTLRLARTMLANVASFVKFRGAPQPGSSIETRWDVEYGERSASVILRDPAVRRLATLTWRKLQVAVACESAAAARLLVVRKGTDIPVLTTTEPAAESLEFPLVYARDGTLRPTPRAFLKHFSETDPQPLKVIANAATKLDPEQSLDRLKKISRQLHDARLIEKHGRDGFTRTAYGTVRLRLSAG